MNAYGEFIEVQGTAERAPFSRSMFDELLKLAYKGIGELLAIQRRTLAAIDEPET
jgi:ribonuclease PH